MPAPSLTKTCRPGRWQGGPQSPRGREPATDVMWLQSWTGQMVAAAAPRVKQQGQASHSCSPGQHRDPVLSRTGHLPGWRRDVTQKLEPLWRQGLVEQGGGFLVTIQHPLFLVAMPLLVEGTQGGQRGGLAGLPRLASSSRAQAILLPRAPWSWAWCTPCLLPAF